MTFTVRIAADGAGSAGSEIAGVTSELAKNEVAAGQARDAIGRFTAAGVQGGSALAAAMREDAAALDKTRAAAAAAGSDLARLNGLIAATNAETAHTKTETTGAAEGFDKLIDAMNRQAAMLEKIRGPVKEYEADLKALNSLMDQGRINTSEYNTQLEKIEKRVAVTGGKQYGPTQAPPQPPGAPPPAAVTEESSALGALGAVAGVFAAGGAIMGVVSGVRQIVDEMHNLEDQSIKATNAAQKFVDSQHNVQQVMAEQLDLADKLHGSYDTTIKLYDKVREGSDGVALSHNEQLRLTQELGEAVQLSNKPIDAAAGLMSKFAFAMQSGQIEARQLRNILREVPAIAHTWTEAFNTTDLGLMAMVKSGKVSIADLVTALTADSERMHERFSNLRETNEQAIDNDIERFRLQRQHIKDVVADEGS